MVEAGAGKLPGDLQVALGVGAAGDRLLEVVGGDEGGGGLEVDRVGQLGLDLPAQGAEPDQLVGRGGGRVLVGRPGQGDLAVAGAVAAGLV